MAGKAAGIIAAMSIASTLPAVFLPVLAGLEEIESARLGGLFHECFGCGPNHELGLRVRCFRSGAEALSPIIVPARFAGPPGAAHGGIVAAYLDEVLSGAVVSHTGRVHVTGELSVRYVRPTPVERPLLGRGRAVRAEGKYVDLEGTIEDLDTREVVARATARFFPVPGASRG